MPAIVAEAVEGQTARITFQLQEVSTAGVTSNLDGTGFTVSDLLLTTCDGRAVDTTSDFGWVSAAAGTVYYDPDAADFVAQFSPYRVRVKITDGDSKIRYYPSSVDFALITVAPVR
jgi:hypothetical protein